MAFSKHCDDLRLVMVGKTGTGKSKTANTILGENRFVAGTSGKSLTKKCTVNSGHKYERDIRIVDTPGLFDTDDNIVIMTEIVRCIILSTPGPHALLFTIPIGRFTQEDIETVNKFTSQFGEKMKDFIIIVFTRFDDWKRDQKGQDCNFERYIESLPDFAKHFVTSQCKNRYIPFDNTLENVETQVKDLIAKIDEMVSKNGGTFYTNRDYEEAEKKIKEIQEEEKRKMDERMKEEKEIRDAEIRKTIEQRMAEERKKMDTEFEEREKKIKMEFEEMMKKEQKLYDKEYMELNKSLSQCYFMEKINMGLKILSSGVQLMGAATSTGHDIWNKSKLLTPQETKTIPKINEVINQALVAYENDISKRLNMPKIESEVRHDPLLEPTFKGYQYFSDFMRQLEILRLHTSFK